MTGARAAAVLAIYRAGIDEGNATFETRAPAWTVFTAARLPGHQFVAVTAGQVAGWVAASPVSGRCVYAGPYGFRVDLSTGPAILPGRVWRRSFT